MMRKIVCFFLILIFSFSFLSYSQTDAGIKIISKQGGLYDEVKNLNNPYSLPLWGKKLGEKGFFLPYPIGIMLNGYVGEQDVTISNLSVGFNDGDMINLDKVVGFGEVSASVRNFNMRTDVWLLPFLDLYGIFGKAWVETSVGIGSIAGQPVDIHTQANFDGYVYGFGMMLTGGIRSIFFSLDFNNVWTHFDELSNDNTAMNLSPRVGYVFHFRNKPERNISVWTGAGRVFLNNTTKGTIPVSEIVPDITKGDWYHRLSPKEQELIDQIISNHQGDVVHYSLDKRPSHNWCMILGGQFQLNRHWQFRVESNLLGGRRSGLISANYRFGFF